MRVISITLYIDIIDYRLECCSTMDEHLSVRRKNSVFFNL
jgi:hypothetical protein